MQVIYKFEFIILTQSLFQANESKAQKFLTKC
jgi:hypothetical protein